MGFFKLPQLNSLPKASSSRRLDPQALIESFAGKLVYSEEELRDAIGQAANDVFRSITIASDITVSATITIDVDRLEIRQAPTTLIYPDSNVSVLFDIQADYVRLSGLRTPDYGSQNGITTFCYVNQTVRDLRITRCEIGAGGYFLLCGSSGFLNEGRFQDNILKGASDGSTDLHWTGNAFHIVGNTSFFRWDLIALSNNRQCVISNNTMVQGNIDTSAGVQGRNTITGNVYVTTITTAGTDAQAGNS